MIYTEEEFVACLLVNGWVHFHNYTNSQQPYWQSVDEWLTEMWPEREHLSGHTSWPMEFKIQFWTWGKDLFNDMPTNVLSPHRIPPNH